VALGFSFLEPLSRHELWVITMFWALSPFDLCTSNPQIMAKNVKSFKLNVLHLSSYKYMEEKDLFCHVKKKLKNL